MSVLRQHFDIVEPAETPSLEDGAYEMDGLNTDEVGNPLSLAHCPNCGGNAQWVDAIEIGASWNSGRDLFGPCSRACALQLEYAAAKRPFVRWPGDGAIFSADRLYRYVLWRRWEIAPTLVVVGLNPSTADESANDPTIRRCIDFAKTWGCGGLVMLNLYGLRSTDPKGLLGVADPVGPDNDRWLEYCTSRAAIRLAAWGASKQPQAARAQHVITTFGPFHCLGRTKAGHPRHPLYVKGDTPREVL